jgi:hypothetical protein
MRLWKRPNEDIAVDQEPERSLARRHLLRYGGMAAAGAAGAALITAVDATPAAAGVDGDVVMNTLNAGATDTTGIEGNLNQAEVAEFLNDASAGAGVRGRCGTDSGNFAIDVNEIAVGVYGESGSTPGVGVWGVAPFVGARGTGDTGVRGDGTTFGVLGRSAAGTAIQGVTLSTDNPNPAVAATSNGSGPAVRAQGHAVFASTGVGAGNGAALDVRGRAAFTRSAVLTVPAGASSAFTALVPGGLLATSHVLATVQENKGSIGVRAAVPITAAGANRGKIQVFLTGAAPAGGVKVAWFVLG